MSRIEGYVLRIVGKEPVDHVFELAIYYTNLNRKWTSGQIIFFLHKSELGDAFVGYGVIERIMERDELCDQERAECERGGWKMAIEFRYVRRLERQLLIKETFLKDSKLRGRFFHGLQLDGVQIESLMKQAGVRGFHQKS